MWRIQIAVICLIWSFTFFSTGRHSDAEGTQASDEPNPLLYVDSHSLPYFSKIKADHVAPAMMKVIEDLKISLQEYENQLKANRTLPRTWEFVEEKLEKMQFACLHSWHIISHLISVKSSPELRKAQQSVVPAFANLSNRMGQSLIIYDAFKELKQQNHSLDEAQNRILNTFLLSARLGGAELNEKDKTELNRLSLVLQDSTTNYSNNVLDSIKEYSVLLTDKKSVDGLTELTRRLLAAYAVEGTAQSADPEEGPWKVTLDTPSYVPVMKHSRNRKLRENIYRAFITRSCEGTFDNTELVTKIREYRQKTAEILGYKNYAEVSLASKMVQKVEDVTDFLKNLHEKSYPVALSELEKLTEYAHSKGHKGNLENWDTMFWKERQFEELYSIKEEDVRPYFPLEKVLSGLFKLTTQLFGVTVKAADGDADVWDPSVRFFKVYDENEKHIASFYLDSFSRPKEKKSGAWLDELFTRSSLLNHIPVVYLITNQIPPVGSTPSLMSFTELTTLFHEYGHALHTMLTTVKYGGASGNHNIEWDAVEVPSQFMENWLYDWSTISLISGHYQTQETLPKTMFQQFYRARQYFGGYLMQNQLYLSILDMELHTSDDPWKDIMKRVSDTYAVPKTLPEDCLPTSFAHIFSSGSYAAGYYSYKWAELLAQDEFDEFDKIGLSNRDQIKLVGKRYRDTVLSLGGGEHPMEIFRKFMGRGPSQDALLRKYGLFNETE